MFSKNPTYGHGNTSFCANFVKFGLPEVGEIARYLMDKKQLWRPVLDLQRARPWSASEHIREVFKSCALSQIYDVRQRQRRQWNGPEQ